MKSSILKKLSISFGGLACSFAISFSAMAATPAGTLEGADESSVYGWVWDSDSYSHIIPVEISIYPTGSANALKAGTVKADHYQDKLQTSIGDGYHGFKYSVDWNQFEQNDLRVTAYAVTETERVYLGELTYNKETKTGTLVSSQSGQTSQAAPSGPSGESAAPGTAVSQEAPVGSGSSSLQGPGGSSASLQGPGESRTVSAQSQAAPTTSKTGSTAQPAAQAASSASEEQTASWQKGPGVTPPKKKPQEKSLGMFTTTGYCGCDLCCAGNTLTYSGTVPQPGHTVSADITVFPIGTKLKIGDTVYTVEDIGSNVVENKIDIFYATHEEAAAHGTQTEEVFSVE